MPRTPSVALANASREVQRIADGLQAMRKGPAEAFGEGADRDMVKTMGRMDDVVDRLHRAVHADPARIPRESLGDGKGRRLAEVHAFAIAREHAAGVVESDLLHHAGRHCRGGLTPAPEKALHAILVQQLRLAVAVFTRDDAAAAQP